MVFLFLFLGEGQTTRRNDTNVLRNAYDKYVRKVKRYHVVDRCVNGEGKGKVKGEVHPRTEHEGRDGE